MKKILFLLAALAAVIDSSAAKKTKLEPWQDPNVFEENRLSSNIQFYRFKYFQSPIESS